MSYKEVLNTIKVKTDQFDINNDELTIDGCGVTDLINQYGSPLFVLSENTLRQNIQRIKSAFTQHWPTPINVMFAIKANTNFAVRAICHQEGLGGDCFGPGEVEATYRGGADPQLIALNGTVKSEEAIRKAITYGYAVHLDSYEEIEIVEQIAKELDAKNVRIGVRLKVLPDTYFQDYVADAYPFPDFLGAMRWIKFGLLKESAINVIERVKQSSRLTFYGFHTHLGRFGKDLAGWDALYRQYAKDIIEVCATCNVTPFMVDLGGGWPRERDPESRNQESNPNTIEQYAEVVCKGMLDEFTTAGLPIPQLWLEPGRYIAGNMGTLLTSVNLVKRDADLAYTTCDASTYLAILVESQESKNAILPATKMTHALTMKSDIVGPICIPSLWSSNINMPELNRNDILAILDVGHYAESQASQFNSLPRPATVLVNNGQVELIKRAETIEDLFSTQIIPPRLKKITN